MSLFGGVTLPGKPDPENIRRLDQLPVPMTMQMMRVGFAIDIPALNELSSELGQRMTMLREEICSWIPEEKLDEFIGRSNLNGDDDYLPMNVESGSQLAVLLFETLGIGEGRQLKMTKGGTRISTGKKQLETIKRSHPLVQTVLDYRECSKLKGTYADALPRIAKLHPRGQCPVCELHHVESTRRIHTTLLDTRTDTRRYASKLPNLQNIPVRTAWGRRIRSCFIASPGKVLVSSDYSQEEMRIGAHYSEDPGLMEIFAKKLDPHLVTAIKVFKLDKDKIPAKGTKEFEEFKLSYRDPSRHLNFGIFYGLTPPGLTDQIAVTYATAGRELPDEINEDWSKGVIDDWYSAYSGVLEYLENQHYRARRYGIVWDLFGGVRRVPETKSVHSRIHQAGLRQSGNTPIQMTGADIMRLTMGEMVANPEIASIRDSGVSVEPILTIHDDLIYEVDEDYGSMVGSIVEDVQRNLLRDKQTGEYLFRVPLEADAKVSYRWEK